MNITNRRIKYSRENIKLYYKKTFFLEDVNNQDTRGNWNEQIININN